ncbi:uncharacterized protein FA14DRAFT_189289 [Meira miltonrushii]|uniref:C-CAP/cofactor C-like domain-containing protein n=1 Tax=Meira miltonrushii TaxID=1280837 RepID=A0A316VDA6_9BASI|nr:uncharacterized protein FA14DRAFT_189289 [Meira miltonrushii]PWN35304.1 hypothetical protein FA14DRAFT_189289 [Meira miltonrushii]
MASTSSLGASTSTNSSEAQQFYHAFNKTLEDLRSKLESANSTEQLQEINAEIIEARTTLTNNTHILPTYDQRTHEQNLKRVNEYLQLRRLELKPKARFAFKRTTKASQPSSSTDKAQDGTANPSSEPSSDSLAAIPASKAQHTSFDRISDRKDEYIIPNVKPQSDLHLRDLQGCIVDLRAKEYNTANDIQALQLRDLQQCVIFAGRIDGSVMIHDCQNCLFILECRQFRMHSSQNIFVLISTKSIATIEHCTKIAFGPASASSLDIKEEVEDATYDIPKVQDFDHISTLTPSPNWRSVGKEDLLTIAQKLEGEHRNAKEILSALFF